MNEILKQNKTAFYVFDVKTLKDRWLYYFFIKNNKTNRDYEMKKYIFRLIR